MAFGNRVLTTTQDYIMPRLVDTVLNSNVFATRMLTAAKPFRGETMKFPVKVTKNNTGTSFSGFDTFSTAAVDNRINLSYNPKFYQITVALPMDELSVNQDSETKVMDLLSLSVRSAAQDMADSIGNLFYGDGTGNGGKDFLGLGAIVDDGTAVATIGGQSRAANPTLASTVTAAGAGKLSLANMATLFSAVASGSQKPTLGLCNELVWNLYEQLLQPQERIVKDVPMMRGKLIGGTGFSGLNYRGFEIVSDEKCTSGELMFINENFIQWYARSVAMTEAIKFSPVEIAGNDYEGVMGLGFSWSGWIKPSNSASVIGHIYLGGELTTDNPKRHGKLTGITTI